MFDSQFLAILVVSSTAATYVATNLIQYKALTIQALNEVMEWSLETQYDGNFNSTNRWSRLWDLGHIEVSNQSVSTACVKSNSYLIWNLRLLGLIWFGGRCFQY